MPAVYSSTPLLQAPLRLGNLLIDEERHHVYVGDRRAWITHLEFRLLLELATSTGSVVTREELLARVWGDPSTPPRRLDVQISRLRSRLRGLDPYAIVTVRKRGYALATSTAARSTVDGTKPLGEEIRIA
jgi:DNA-binding response OmpR family regulator